MHKSFIVVPASRNTTCLSCTENVICSLRISKLIRQCESGLKIYARAGLWPQLFRNTLVPYPSSVKLQGNVRIWSLIEASLLSGHSYSVCIADVDQCDVEESFLLDSISRFWNQIFFSSLFGTVYLKIQDGKFPQARATLSQFIFLGFHYFFHFNQVILYYFHSIFMILSIYFKKFSLAIFLSGV